MHRLKARTLVSIFLLLAMASLHARDYGWYLSLGAGGGAVLPSGGYIDFMGQELANQEGHSVFLMGPAANLAAHGGIGFLPWLGVGMDLGASLGIPLFFGEASAWIFYAPTLTVAIGPDFSFKAADSLRFRISPRLGAATLPLGLWEGSSFGGVSSLSTSLGRGPCLP
jgi:hypothetical protein